MPDNPSFDVIARELYAGPTATFVARRTAAVKDARAQRNRDLARRLGALRRPTAAAAAVNGLPAGDLEEVSALAARMRDATHGLRTEELKELSVHRSRMLARIVSGIDGGAGVRDEVRSTLLAALADPRAEAAVRSRTLVRALSYAGFGEVEIDGAEAVAEDAPAAAGRAPEQPASPSPQTPLQASAPPTLRLVPSEKLLDEARLAVDVAQRRLAGAQDAFDAAEAALASARQGLDAARARLRNLEKDRAP